MALCFFVQAPVWPWFFPLGHLFLLTSPKTELLGTKKRVEVGVQEAEHGWGWGLGGCLRHRDSEIAGFLGSRAQSWGHQSGFCCSVAPILKHAHFTQVYVSTQQNSAWKVSNLKEGLARFLSLAPAAPHNYSKPLLICSHGLGLCGK